MSTAGIHTGKKSKNTKLHFIIPALQIKYTLNYLTPKITQDNPKRDGFTERGTHVINGMVSPRAQKGVSVLRKHRDARGEWRTPSQARVGYADRWRDGQTVVRLL